MRLRLRMMLLILASFFRERLSLVDENVLRLTVLPNDVDVTRLSSDRYLPLMDLGRVNIFLRAGLFWTLVRNRWIPVARVVMILCRYPLKMFQRFQLRTRVVLGCGVGVDRASLRAQRPHDGYRTREGGVHRARRASCRSRSCSPRRGSHTCRRRPRNLLPSCRAWRSSCAARKIKLL